MRDSQATFVRAHNDTPELLSWVDRTGLAPLNDGELDAAYKRAHEFILNNKDSLVKDCGWTESEAEDDELFSVSSPSGACFSLPKKFSSLKDSVNVYLIDFVQRRRPSRIDFDLVVTGPKPLSNIFYMLQCMAPGMILLVWTDEDGHIEEYVRPLPADSWASDHENSLTTILGGTEAYEALLDACEDDNRSFHNHVFGYENFDEDLKTRREQRISNAWEKSLEDWICSFDDEWHFDDRNDGEFLDLTACGSDCGYCGHCEYP